MTRKHGVRALRMCAAAAALFSAPPLMAKSAFVNEDLVRVAPPDARGNVVVVASARCVALPPNALGTVVVENAATKVQSQQTVRPDGGFMVQIRAREGDKLRIRIASSAGDRKKITRKVGPPLPGSRDGTSRRTPPSRPRLPEPTPEIVIHYMNAPAAPASPPPGAEDEVAQSGVLPPD